MEQIAQGNPVFVAHFADGETTRMTVFCHPGQLDVGRGVRLAHHAYRSRMEKEPPAISKAHFEDSVSRVVLANYSAEQLT